MALNKKFHVALGTGVLAMAGLAGCGVGPTPEQEAQGYATVPEHCVVVDVSKKSFHAEASSGVAYGTTYDFKNGAIIFNTLASGTFPRSSLGLTTQFSQLMSMKDLQEDGQAKALEMFSKLPASANCKSPKF